MAALRRRVKNVETPGADLKVGATSECTDPFAQLRADTKDGRHSAPSHRAILAFPTKKSGGWLSIVAIIVQFREKKVYFAGHFVITAFVFIDIPGGSFIFNIS